MDTIRNLHGPRAANPQGVKTAAKAAKANPKTETTGNATDNTKNPEVVANPQVKESPEVRQSRDPAANPQVKVSPASKANLGKENPVLVTRGNPKAPNEAMATRNPNKTPTAKKLPSNASAENSPEREIR
jgi:hypothetical protein